MEFNKISKVQITLVDKLGANIMDKNKEIFKSILTGLNQALDYEKETNGKNIKQIIKHVSSSKKSNIPR